MKMINTKLIVAVVAIAGLMTGCNSKQVEFAKEQQMETIFPKGEKIISENFTGEVWVHMMGANDSTLYTRFGNVTFAPGARTNGHSHAGGQILLVTEGRGYYQTKGQPAQPLKKGDVVEIPRDVVHWHGAAPDSEFAHLAFSLNLDDGGVVWLEPVSDEEYNDL